MQQAYLLCVCGVVERVVGREQQTAHTKSTERATAKGVCLSTDYRSIDTIHLYTIHYTCTAFK